MIEDQRPLAVVTGASSGIGYELAKLAAEDGYDLVIAADEPSIVEAQAGSSSTAARSSRCRSTCRPPRASTSCWT
jgi:short-subunit dehydrogenase